MTRLRFAHRAGRIAVSATKLMPMLAARVEAEGGEACVSLGQGVPSFACPEHVRQAVCRALVEDHTAGKYSLQPGMPALRRVVAAHLETELGASFDPETEVAATVGAMGGLACAVLALVGEGDEVLLPRPNYASHAEQVLLAGAAPVYVPLGQDWSLDPEAFAAAMTERTRAVIIANPHNPTGAVFADEAVARLARLCAERGVAYITDETYRALVFDGPPPLSPLSLPECRETTVGCFSFSKRYALTGWRVGFVAAHAPLLAELLKVHDCTAICAPTPSQHAALAALAGPQEPFEAMRLALARRRDVLCRRLDAMAPHMDYVRPGGAFYVMARYRLDMASRELAERLVREARVVTVPGGSFGAEGFLRLSFGGEDADIEAACDRLAAWFVAR